MSNSSIELKSIDNKKDVQGSRAYDKKDKVINNIALSGGGTKGISLVGAFHALEYAKLLPNITKFAGTSIGCVINTLYVIGYSPAEMYDFVKLFDFKKLKNIDLLNLHMFSIDDASKLEYVLKRLITGKGFTENITLLELYELTQKKLIYTTCCLNTKEVCYISYQTNPDIELLTIIKMSIAIPVVYPPVEYQGKYYVDGACFNNYPFNVFSDELDNTIGILIIDINEPIEVIDNFETYIFTVLDCIKAGMAFNCKKGFENNTIEIPLSSVSIIDFDIDPVKKDELFMKGYEQTINYLNDHNLF